MQLTGIRRLARNPRRQGKMRGMAPLVMCLIGFGVTSFAAKPDGTNTGYKNAVGYPGSLGAMGAGVTPQSNQTYSNLNYANGVSVPSGVNNVTFYGCRFASNATADANSVVSGDNIKFDYCTFEPSAKSAPPVTYFQGYQSPQASGGKETYTGRAGGAMAFSSSGTNAYYPYRPYLYPHPLVDGGPPAQPHPPQGLRVR